MKVRFDLNITRQTISLWSYLNMPENIDQFVNPTYERNDAVLWPSVAPQSIVSLFFVSFHFQLINLGNCHRFWGNQYTCVGLSTWKTLYPQATLILF